MNTETEIRFNKKLLDHTLKTLDNPRTHGGIRTVLLDQVARLQASIKALSGANKKKAQKGLKRGKKK